MVYRSNTAALHVRTLRGDLGYRDKGTMGIGGEHWRAPNDETLRRAILPQAARVALAVEQQLYQR
ncbi:hypothetical protein KCP74_16015 [Salmonella enterica subsp. enterica]|nr:hypothetical protein KCP74_16015 [Salmonella enterica subsp. enterica]